MNLVPVNQIDLFKIKQNNSKTTGLIELVYILNLTKQYWIYLLTNDRCKISTFLTLLFQPIIMIDWSLAEGIANPNSSGPFTSLGQLASTIEPGKDNPILLFEGQER